MNHLLSLSLLHCWHRPHRKCWSFQCPRPPRRYVVTLFHLVVLNGICHFLGKSDDGWCRRCFYSLPAHSDYGRRQAHWSLAIRLIQTHSTWISSGLFNQLPILLIPLLFVIWSVGPTWTSTTARSFCILHIIWFSWLVRLLRWWDPSQGLPWKWFVYA